jgi:hypothetical protein
MQPGISLGKVGALTGALCKLHNYCIDQNDELVFVERDEEDIGFVDVWRGIQLQGPDNIPIELLINEASYETEDPYSARNSQRNYQKYGENLLRTHIHKYIVENNYKRPS